MHNPFYTCIMKDMIRFGLFASKGKSNRSEQDSEKNQRSVSFMKGTITHAKILLSGKELREDVVMVSYKIISGTETGTRHQLFNVSSSTRNRKS